MTGGLSMLMLDETVVSVALATMKRELPLSSGGQQWVVNAYVLAMATTVALGGRLGAKLGPVTTFRLGVWVFSVASALCGLTPSGGIGHEWLIAARVVQGCGAALMMPVSASIVMAAFPPAVRGRAMGVYVGVSQLFLVLGPLLGGALTGWVTWRAVFWINVPVGLAVLVLVRRARPADPVRPSLSVSTVHGVLLVGGVGTTVYALQQSAQWGWSSARALLVLAVGLATTAVFTLVQMRSADPLVRVRLLRHRGFAGDVVVLLTTQFSLLPMAMFAALYTQNVLGYSPAQAGLASLALIGPLMTGAALAGRWYDRSGVRAPVLTGLTLAAAGASQWAADMPHIALVSKLPGVALVGFGLGLVLTPVNTDALGRVPADERPQASGIVHTVRQLGGTLGVAVVGAVILAHEHPVPPALRAHDTAEAMKTGFLAMAAVFAAALVAAWALLPREPSPSDA
ncbi:DHA2 family efflux MFS transporter permease subunit [Streptomyces sp. CA-181903]|uniref:DHA2 family efflux MFS transporter permease subunit n=1 Tax=Streptomyces sp. CA-181903 TaxID=3240055 RepID=UPI003D8DE226